MQADTECNTSLSLIVPQGVSRERAWLWARDEAIRIARAFEAAGYHKQVINRLLEPFMHITVLVSSTEWDNFLELRDHKDAEPHIQMLAREIRKCLEDESTVQTLEPGQWHLPFAKIEDLYLTDESRREDSEYLRRSARVFSVARCASTSYKTTDGFDMTFERAEAIYDKLHTKPFHASPFEHVAQADDFETFATTPRPYGWQHENEHGNFVGFRQLRRQIELAA